MSVIDTHRQRSASLTLTQEVPTIQTEVGMCDIGRVILPSGTHGMVKSEIVEVKPDPEAIRVLAKAVQKIGTKNMHLVSRVLNNRKELLTAWLKKQHVLELIGITNPVIWCGEWEAKGPIVRKLNDGHGATFCIDDEPQVHEAIEVAYADLNLARDDRRLRLYGINYTITSIERHLQKPSRVRVVHSWKEIEEVEGW